MNPGRPGDEARPTAEEEAAFRSASLECITSALSRLLGPSGAEALLAHVEKDYGIRRDEIPVRPSEFADGIRSIFGSGAKLVLSSVSDSLKRSMPQSGFLTEFIGALGQPPASNANNHSRAFRTER